MVTVADTTISGPVVNNSTTAYALRLCMNVGLFFYRARMDYTTP